MLRRVVQRVFVGTHTTAQPIGMEGAMSSKDYDSFVRKVNRHVATRRAAAAHETAAATSQAYTAAAVKAASVAAAAAAAAAAAVAAAQKA